jgi:hypothetical protein
MFAASSPLWKPRASALKDLFDLNVDLVPRFQRVGVAYLAYKDLIRRSQVDHGSDEYLARQSNTNLGVRPVHNLNAG